MSNASTTLGLYRQMLRNSRLFKDFNVRSYAIRSVRTRFRENKDVNDPIKLEGLWEEARSQLNVLHRQASISQLYGFAAQPSAVEGYKD